MSKERKNKVGTPSSELTERDLAADIMGNNQLQGEDQAAVRNQRHAVPDAKPPDKNMIETMKKADKEYRAEKDLDKGKGVHPDEKKL